MGPFADRVKPGGVKEEGGGEMEGTGEAPRADKEPASEEKGLPMAPTSDGDLEELLVSSAPEGRLGVPVVLPPVPLEAGRTSRTYLRARASASRIASLMASLWETVGRVLGEVVRLEEVEPVSSPPTRPLCLSMGKWGREEVETHAGVRTGGMARVGGTILRS